MPQPKTPIGTLCRACTHLKLSPNASAQPISRLKDKTRESIGRTASCPFCRLVQSCRGDYGQFFTWKAERGFYFHKDGARIVFLDDQGSAPSPHQCGRVVESQVNFSLLKEWLRLCEEVHGEECAPAPDTERRLGTLRVIDVEQMCIVEAEIGCRYLTLSYSWGQVHSPSLTMANKAQLMTPHGLESFTGEFPGTIRDAIQLVKQLDERYIWIDRLCLVQDDPRDVLNGMQTMDQIYEGSVVCIVAAAGHDANGGLPGVQTGSRGETGHVEEVRKGVKMTVVHPLYETLSRAHYMTRGWTSVNSPQMIPRRVPLMMLMGCYCRFQELMLAPRCLIFQESMVYYRCCRVVWSEDTVYDRFPSEKHDNVGMSHYLPSLRSTADPDAYQQAIRRYNSRNLTDQNDALNAMAGMLRRMARNLGSVDFQGMVVSHFDLCLLFWHPPAPAAKRRRGFPSWSWVGWQGGAPRWPVGLGEEEAGKWLVTGPHIVWYRRCLQTGELEFLIGPAEYSRRHARPVAQLSHAPSPETESGPEDGLPTKPKINPPLDRGFRKYPALQCWTWVVTIPRFRVDESHLARIMDTRDEECGIVYRDDIEYHLEPDVPYEGILLSKGDSCKSITPGFAGIPRADRPFYWVMIVEREGVVAERRGLGFIYQSHIDHLLSPGKVWKEVILA